MGPAPQITKAVTLTFLLLLVLLGSYDSLAMLLLAFDELSGTIGRDIC
jgi:hypothetical protein